MRKFLLYLIICLMPTGAFAAGEPGTGPNPFTDCGIGAALFNSPSTLDWPIVAVTSNVIWDLGSTASTSATSSPETCSAKRVATAKLIYVTLPELEQNITLGEGKTLLTLMETMECNPAFWGQISSNLRASLAQTVTQESYANISPLQRASNMYDSVRNVTASMGNSCKVDL